MSIAVPLADLSELEASLAEIQSAIFPVAASVTLTPGIFTVGVAWTYTPVALITGFRLYRKTGAGGTWTLLASPVSGDTSYNDASVIPDTTYYYRLDALNTLVATPGSENNATTLTADYDFTAMSDGSLPADFSGATWAIATGKAVNTPTSGGNLLTDPGLEATYTGGKCDTLTKVGSPTLAESADTHGGSKAQAFTGVAVNNAVSWPVVAGIAGRWYRLSVWAKMTSANTNKPFARALQTGLLPDGVIVTDAMSAANYQKYSTSGVSTTANNITAVAVYTNSSSAFSGVVADDGVLEALTTSTLYALLPAATVDIVAKTLLSQPTDGTMTGIVIRASGQTDPTNCIFVAAYRIPDLPTYVNVMVIKKIGSTYSQVLAPTVAGAFSSAAWLEARITGSTLKVYYNGTQKGTDLTISDAELSSGAYHGTFATGENSITRFFQSAL